MPLKKPFLLFHFTDARICRAQTIRMMETNQDDVTAFCTLKPQSINSLFLWNVERINSVKGIYRLSLGESHYCYDVQVLSHMINLSELTDGKYYEIVYRT